MNDLTVNSLHHKNCVLRIICDILFLVLGRLVPVKILCSRTFDPQKLTNTFSQLFK